jgi:phosphatidylserine decarboxylase
MAHSQPTGINPHDKDHTMTIRPEVSPFVIAVALLFGLPALIMLWKGIPGQRVAWLCGVPALICIGYFLFFFRDPERIIPAGDDLIIAAADGTVAAITDIHESKYLHSDCVRISIFLSLFNVHVNRAPIAGKSTFLGYFPGKRLFTFQAKSSEVNQHNKILITNPKTKCLLCQIVGPVCRRVVYWLDHDQTVPVAKGERIGMMKFGSRLDMYFPNTTVDVLVKKGDTVRAGETIVARVRKNSPETKKSLQ